MRNQVHRQRQSVAHQSINHNNYTASPSQNIVTQQRHKSICFIQITDIAQNHHIEQNKCFRNTFFGKLGKRVTPKKNFFNTMIDKLKQNSNYQSMLSKKAQRKIKQGLEPKDYSQRSSFIIKQLNPIHPIQDNNSFSGRQRFQKNENGQGFRKNIIEDIEKLRFTESGYIERIKQKQQQIYSTINDLQNHQQDYLQQEPQLQNYSKLSKEDIILSLREKIKNKQSRKHTYHSLKNKNQAWNKIRIKTHPHFHNQRNTQSQVSYQIESVRLHCKQPKNIIKHAYSKNSKPLHPPIEYGNQLKVQSKPCMLSFNVYDPPSLIPFSKQYKYTTVQSPSSLSNKLKTKRQLYDQIISSVKSSNKNNFSQRSRTGNNSIQINQFGLLTPWKNDYDDLS